MVIEDIRECLAAKTFRLRGGILNVYAPAENEEEEE